LEKKVTKFRESKEVLMEELMTDKEEALQLVLFNKDYRG
jgi:hypothetical protein